MESKRMIYVGPTCCGKTFIKEKYTEKGYLPDVSYTSRPMRPGEQEGIDYNFKTKLEFEELLKDNFFFEHVKYNGNYYGTSNYDWKHHDIFIMETNGIASLSEKDRESSLIIYVATPLSTRLKRMVKRGWGLFTIIKRLYTDYKTFSNFKTYDLKIKS